MAKAAEYKWTQAGEELYYFALNDGRVLGTVRPSAFTAQGVAAVYGAYLDTGEMLGHYVTAQKAQAAVAQQTNLLSTKAPKGRKA